MAAGAKVDVDASTAVDLIRSSKACLVDPADLPLLAAVASDAHPRAAPFTR